MPHTKSAAKRLRSSEKRRQRNRTTIKGVKKQTRAFADALAANDATKAGTELVTAAKKLDKAAARGVIHKNKAARLKSKMARKLNAAKAAPAKG
jgi:small subunit ribosomal protein S20